MCLLHRTPGKREEIQKRAFLIVMQAALFSQRVSLVCQSDQENGHQWLTANTKKRGLQREAGPRRGPNMRAKLGQRAWIRKTTKQREKMKNNSIPQRRDRKYASTTSAESPLSLARKQRGIRRRRLCDTPVRFQNVKVRCVWVKLIMEIF